MAKASNGEYEVDEGLIYSFPCRTRGGAIETIQGVQHVDFSKNVSLRL